MDDWSGLPVDLLELITKKLTHVTDILSFRSVCRPWKRAAWNDHIHTCLPRQMPVLLVADGWYSHRPFSLIKHRFHPKSLSMNELERCRGSSGGWILIIGTREQGLHLFNPFEDVFWHLPPVSTFSKRPKHISNFVRQCYFIKKGAFFRTRNFRECVVMVIHGKRGRLSFARETDEAWNLIKESQWHPFMDVIYADGQFYAVNHRGQVVVVCNLGPHPKIVEFAPTLRADFPERRYLVESSGEFFQVMRNMEYSDDEEDDDDANANENETTNASDEEEDDDDANANENEATNASDDEGNDDANEKAGRECNDAIEEVHISYKTVGFEVFKFDSRAQKWIEVKSLGERAFFLGSNSSFCVSATDFPGCKSNCIYFTDDFLEGHVHLGRYGGFDMGVFNLANRSIEPHYSNTSKLLLPAPIFVEPIPW